MIRVASIVALGLYSLLTFRAMLVVTNFAYNQTEIAQTLCVKKDVPNNTCQGKCHLVKTLGDTSESNAPTNQPSTERIWLVHLAHEHVAVLHEAQLLIHGFRGFIHASGRLLIGGQFQPPELG